MENETLDILVEDLKGTESYRRNVYDDAVAESSPYRYVSRDDCFLHEGQFVVRRTGGVATIGFGETQSEIVDQWWDSGIPYDEAVNLLRWRAAGYLRSALDAITSSDQLNPNQRAALGSMAYNIGVEGFETSSVARMINVGRLDFDTISNAFHLWDNPDGALRGRRNAEIRRFFTPWEGPVGSLDLWENLFVVVFA